MSTAIVLAAALTIGGHVTEPEHFSMRDCVVAAHAQYRAGGAFVTCKGRPVSRAVVRQVAVDATERRVDSFGVANTEACLAELRVPVTAVTQSVWCTSYVQFDGLEIIQIAEGWTKGEY